MSFKLAAILTAIVLAASGCGGDGDKGPDANPKGDKSTASAKPSPKKDPADQAIADAAVLTLRDFPSGWESANDDDDTDVDEDGDGRDDSQAEIAKCGGFDYDTYYNGSSGKADSKEFTNSADETISNSVTVTPSDAATISTFDITKSERFRDCIEKATIKSVKELVKKEENSSEYEIGETTVNELSFEQLGDDSIAFRLKVDLTVSGTQLDIYGDFVFVRVGRAVVSMTSQSVLSPFDVDELAEFAKVSVDRTQAGLTGTSTTASPAAG